MTNQTLWQRVKAQTEYARQCGALKSIPTEYELIEQNGVNFFVRIVTNLIRKEQAKKQQDKKSAKQGKAFNPFLPYEEDLFVADLSETHVCLLNKFNVVDHHLLIITRGFEAQKNLLTSADFTALWHCFTEINGFGFYNGGADAGASQRHKHLQVVPLPLIPDGTSVPIQAAIANATFQDNIGKLGIFPFQHALIRLDWDESTEIDKIAQQTLNAYHQLLDAVKIEGSDGYFGEQTQAYNLLITREWMLIVPRSQGSYQQIAINSLGIGGAMLVRSREQLEQLKAISPFKILEQVTVQDSN